MTKFFKSYRVRGCLRNEGKMLVLVFKSKGDVQSCGNCRGIKLMSHTIKFWECVLEARLRAGVSICEQQNGFMSRQSTTDTVFALGMLMEKFIEGGSGKLHYVFVDIEKAYDRIQREEPWYSTRKSGETEKCIKVVQDMKSMRPLRQW